MKRIVIKIGSQIILDDEESNSNYLSNILNEIVSLKSKGFTFTIVSSGAVALAKKHIAIKKSQEGTTSSKQALSSIGQVYLMNKYKSFFNLHNIECAQVLAGRDNFNSRLAYLNIRSALEELYSYNVIPIINENDVVSTMEIEGKFYGDNDRLAAIVANAIDADQLILFGKTKGLYTSDPSRNTNSKIIKKVEKIDDEITSYASSPGDNIGSGGMKSKIEAAKICMESGIRCSISNVEFDNTIFRIFMVLLIVSACVVDKSLALLLAISYMVSLNRLHRLQMSNVQTVSSRPTAIFDDMSNAMPLEQPAQERVPEVEGFQNGGKSENNKFTSGEQLEDCQNNLVGGEENQTNQVQSWKNEMGPQGLSLPIGGANANSLPAPFN